MSVFTQFFLDNIILVYFIYGLSFFSMGLAVLLEVGHAGESDFASALKMLGWFGLIHGLHEWFEMFLLIRADLYSELIYLWVAPLRFALLSVSFFLLIAFGARLIAGPGARKKQILIFSVMILVWLAGLVWVVNTQPPGPRIIISADVYTRYSLAIPGSVLAAWGLFVQRKRFLDEDLRGFAADVTIAAVAFLLYGCIGQLFAAPSAIFPSGLINADVFIQLFGFPIQVFRALMAAVAAIFIIRSLRAFEVENRQRIQKLREARLAERERLENARSDLLHRTVIAQENERRRIALELHDETGQTLTALGVGLRGLSRTIKNDQDKAVDQAHQLEGVVVSGLNELQHLVSGLRPPQLDDLGLLPALRWYAREMSERYEIPINVSTSGEVVNLPGEIRVVFFRIAQEAITNVVRHASADLITITLARESRETNMSIVDDGIGFYVDELLGQVFYKQSLGLLGMQERAVVINADFRIISHPGEGTRVELVWREPDKPSTGAKPTPSKS